MLLPALCAHCLLKSPTPSSIVHTYREASWSFNYPQLTMENMCWSVSGFRACADAPKISNTLASGTLAMPTEQTLWLRTHAGIPKMLVKQIKAFDPKYKSGISGAGTC